MTEFNPTPMPDSGVEVISLNVFVDNNERAQAVYQRRGYG